MSCFGKRNKYNDDHDETTVVYRIEALNENEAAFLPQDLPEVVLDGSRMTTDTRTLIEAHASGLPNGKARSVYSESTYSPQIQIMPMTPVRKKSTLNRATSLESVHILQNPRKYKRPVGPNYIPVNTASRYGSEYGRSTYSHPMQVRRQYLVPYKPVYIKPQAYHYSLPRPNNTRMYRVPSNAESYTLSRPPGRAQPIRIQQQQQFQQQQQQQQHYQQHYQQQHQQLQLESEPILTRKLEDVSKLNLMEYENKTNIFSHQGTNHNNFLSDQAAEDELIIEAALEPPANAAALKYSKPSRPHVKDIQYAHPRDVTPSSGTSNKASPGGVEISPVQPEGGEQESEEWQEVSLYVRRPSLEDVRRVQPIQSEHDQNRMQSQQNTMQMHPVGMATTTATTHSHRVQSSSSRNHSYGQTIISHQPQQQKQQYQYQQQQHQHQQHQQQLQYQHQQQLQQQQQQRQQQHQQLQHHREHYQHHHSHSSLPPSAGDRSNVVIRTTIPRDPPMRQQSRPMIMVNDEAMQF